MFPGLELNKLEFVRLDNRRNIYQKGSKISLATELSNICFEITIVCCQEGIREARIFPSKLDHYFNHHRILVFKVLIKLIKEQYHKGKLGSYM